MLGLVSLETAALIPLAHILPPKFVSQKFCGFFSSFSFLLVLLMLVIFPSQSNVRQSTDFSGEIPTSYH